MPAVSIAVTGCMSVRPGPFLIHDDTMIVGQFTLAARLFQRLRTAVVRPRTVESADD